MAEIGQRNTGEMMRRYKEEEERDKWIEECRKRNEKEREEKEEKKRIDEEWRRIEKMRMKEERKAEKEWRQQEIREARREENRRKAMEEKKCFECGGFGHIASHCRNRGGEKPVQVSSNRFEVLKVRVMQRGEGSGKEVEKDRKEILREEKAKRGVEKKKKKEKYLSIRAPRRTTLHPNEPATVFLTVTSLAFLSLPDIFYCFM